MVTKKHPFLTERDAQGAWIVLRLDTYSQTPEKRGQFYPEDVDEADLASGKAIWPTEKQALAAAQWAATKFAKTYGVFRLTKIVERSAPPLKVINI